MMEQSRKAIIAPNKSGQGATALITHHVREGKENIYRHWLKEIFTACKSYPGHLDIHVIHPIHGLTETYSIMIRFDTDEHLRGWVESDVCQSYIEKVQPILSKEEDIYIKSGLDFWFTPEGAKAQLPKCWKQFVVTWSAIYPVTLTIEILMPSLLEPLGIPNNIYLNTFFVTGFSVLAMVYAVMPRYTKLVQRWLFDEKQKPTH